MLTTYRKIMVRSLWPLLFLLDLNQDWKKEKNKSCWSQVVTMPVYFGCVLRGFVPNWSSKTQTPSFCSHTESSCHKDHLAPKIRDESNPQWLRLAQLLDPHAPPTVRVPLSVTAGVSPSRLLLAAEPGMVFVGGKILELWKLGFRRGNLYRNRDGFLLGNWGIPILQSNQLQTGKFWFPSSQRSREGGFGFQPLDSIYLAMAQNILLPMAGWLGNMIHKICGPKNQCTYKFWRHRHIVYNWGI